MAIPAGLCAVGLAVLGWQSHRYYAAMPPWVASHFALSGQADGFLPKGVFFELMWVIYVIVFAYALFGTRLGLRPARFVPEPSYWLAPERRDQTLRWCQAHAAWEGVMTFIFLYAVVEFVADANLAKGGTLAVRPFLAVLFAFIAAILGSRWHFRRSHFVR